MPLFMDRHDVPGISAADVAELHARDLTLAYRHNVEFLSYWLDAERGGVFCIANAPASEALAKRARVRHLGLWGVCPRTLYDPYRGVETRR